MVWTHPVAVPVNLNGPADRAFTPPPSDFTERAILDLLSQVAAPSPDTIAVVGTNERLTYAELLTTIGRIANYVAGVVPAGEAIATVLPNSPTGFAAMLGCVVAGRVCIILDPAHPPRRNAVILGDAQPAAVLLSNDFARSPATEIPSRIPRLTLEAALGQSDGESWASPTKFDPDAPALVHYTSGSTGKPKGIVISTRVALRRSLLYLEAWHFTGADRFLGSMQPSTNAGFCSSFAALCGGARLLVHSLAGEGMGTLFSLAQTEGLTLMDASPSVVRLLFSQQGAKSAFSRLRVLRSAGEPVLRADIANWREVLPQGCHFAHAYGSTEAMNVAYWFVPPDYADHEPRLPAGYPLIDQEYALIDASGANVPDGQSGELVLRSRHVACGEWRDGRCIPGRFWPDSSRPGWRILRTGDVVRLGSDGLLRFVTRADRQIKIHGVLVEPDEVESVLRGTPGVADAAVVARDHDGETMLVAFVAAEAGRHHALSSLLRERLRAELPPSLRPTQIIMLDRMPYLPGGKIDLLRLTDAGSGPRWTQVLGMNTLRSVWQAMSRWRRPSV